MFSRRGAIAVTALALPRLARGAAGKSERFIAEVARLEQINGGRVGVSMLDTANGEHSGYRAEERFPMCSTFKFLLASAVLKRVDGGKDRLDSFLAIPTKPLLSHSPLTEPHIGGRMTIGALCSAIMTQSDNTAANLLLENVGGPAAITDFARSVGDTVTRLDRTEPSLNESLAGDSRDTTSPAAMAGDLRSILLGPVLKPVARDRLTLWMKDCITGRDRLRAKLPGDWQVADKTGSNGEHTSNDIAVVWPAGRRPVIIAAFITQCMGPESKRAAMLADIGRLVQERLGVA